MPRTPALFGWLLAAAFLVLLNETTVGVALPAIMHAFDQPSTAAQWLVSGYLLALGCVLPLAGTLIERLGPTRTLAVSSGVFLIGCILALCASDLWMLILARIVQAAGGAPAVPLLTTAVMRSGSPRRRGRVLGVVSLAIGAAPALGPTVSGLLIGIGGWRMLFLPSALLCLAVLLRVLPAWRRTGDEGTGLAHVDVASIALAVVAAGSVTVSIDLAFTGAHPAWALALVGASTGIVFARRQLRLAERGAPPVLDLRTLRVPRFARGVIAVAVGMCGLFGLFALMPVDAGIRWGFAPLTTGLLMLPGGLLMAVLAPVVGRIAEQVPPRILAVGGFAVMAIAATGFAVLAPGSAALLTGLHVVLSCGFALAITPLYLDALDDQDPGLVPHATALISTTQQIAAAAGTVAVIAVSARTSAAGYGVAAALLLVAALVMSLRRGVRREADSP